MKKLTTKYKFIFLILAIFTSKIKAKIKMEQKTKVTNFTKNELMSFEPFYVKTKSNALIEEGLFVKKRKQIIKNNLERILDIKIEENHVPVISICCSGGGFRSMLATTGMLCGAKDIGLLDSTMYLTTLSGSSWAAIPWYLENKNTAQLNQFKNELVIRLDKFHNLTKIKKLNLKKLKEIKQHIAQIYQEFLKVKKVKKQYNETTNFVDLYGIVLAKIVLENFENKGLNLKLSSLSEKLEMAEKPFPIFTAVSQLNKEYQWAEFTPFNIGFSSLNYYISPKALARKFSNGVTQNFTPEPSISYLLGIFGSAFSGSFKDALHKITRIPLPKEFEEFILKTESKINNFDWANRKIATGHTPNFSFGMEGSPVKNVYNLEFVDGGYLNNLPVAPILEQERKSDIIFILDNTSQKITKPAIDLHLAQLEAQKNNKKFPPIDYEKAISQNISIFKDENDPDCPVVVYIPLIEDPTYNKNFDPQKAKFCKTTNFSYSKEQAETLSGLSEHVIKNNKKLILDLIRDVVATRKTKSCRDFLSLSNLIRHPDPLEQNYSTKDQKPALEKAHQN